MGGRGSIGWPRNAKTIGPALWPDQGRLPHLLGDPLAYLPLCFGALSSWPFRRKGMPRTRQRRQALSASSRAGPSAGRACHRRALSKNALSQQGSSELLLWHCGRLANANRHRTCLTQSVLLRTRSHKAMLRGLACTRLLAPTHLEHCSASRRHLGSRLCLGGPCGPPS